MDNFNLQGYIASGKLHANSKTLTEAKKQGYDDREDESLGARKGAEKDKKQSMKIVEMILTENLVNVMLRKKAKTKSIKNLKILKKVF